MKSNDQNEGSLAQLVQSIPIYIGRVTVQTEHNLKESLAQLVQSIPIYIGRVTGSNPVTPTSKSLQSKV